MIYFAFKSRTRTEDLSETTIVMCGASHAHASLCCVQYIYLGNYWTHHRVYLNFRECLEREQSRFLLKYCLYTFVWYLHRAITGEC